MPTARRALILQSVKAALQAIAGVPDLVVLRNPSHEISHFPTLVLIDGGHSLDEAEGGSVYRLAYTIEGYVAADDGDAAGDALSDLYAKTVSALLADRTRGGAAFDTLEGDLDVELSGVEGVAPHMVFELQMSARYDTEDGNPYS